MNTKYISRTNYNYNFTSGNCGTIKTLINNYLVQDEEVSKLKEQIQVLAAQNKALKLLLKLNS